MNAVEIEQAISELALQPFDGAEFPFAFLAAFGSKDVALKRLRSGNNNSSDLPGGVLLRNNIHLAVCEPGNVSETFTALLASPATTKAKAKFVLATDGDTLEAQELATGDTLACAYAELPNHFGFLLPLAGISTIQEIKENPIDVRATGRLNKLYVELLRENPEWATAERRSDMNHFMARLVFCFFAEDTDIFNGDGLFTQTVAQFSEPSGGNTHQVLSEVFRAMNIRMKEREAATPRLPNWANGFPYVNGGLFGGSTEVPRFTRMARTYLLHAGALKWREINPDIFGSMIQAVADDEERGALGMHYTSVPNILKVLNPLFLDELRAALLDAGSNERKLLNLRRRIARIRVFDPACGSGNFLVIAYKQLRAIEAEINQRRGEQHLRSEIPLTNFRGIELRDFPAEIARLALIIAEFQCDVLYRGQKDALAEFLPLDAQNWIVCGNALRLDWLQICPPTGTGVRVVADDLFGTPLEQAEIDFENEGGETFICGNPPYLGSKWQTEAHKADLEAVFGGRNKYWKSLDYVAGWFMKAADYGTHTQTAAALVSTNSICQGQQVPMLWPRIFRTGQHIQFAHTSFKWANLASNNAGVTVVIVGISQVRERQRKLFCQGALGVEVKDVENINAYLVAAPDVEVRPAPNPLQGVSPMQFGNHTYYGVDLLMSREDAADVSLAWPLSKALMRDFYGSKEVVSGLSRKCLWIGDGEAQLAWATPPIAQRLRKVAAARSKMLSDKSAQKLAQTPHRFREQFSSKQHTIVVPAISSENRPYLPVGVADPESVIGHKCYALFDAPYWNLALLASRLHWVWIGTVCVRMRTDFSYSNTLGWNTFPLPQLTEQNKADLTRCAEDILLAREAHFPATIADLYDPDNMPDNLRRAHERNDEVLERIYIGRRFKNDTERLEKLFALYTQMTAAEKKAGKPAAKKTVRRKAEAS